MAAKTWEEDFRYEAIQASIRQVRGLGDPFELDGSFCLPLGERPVSGWTPGRVMLIFLIAGFALLGGGVFLASSGEGEPSAAMLAIATISSLTGIACFFVPSTLDGMIMRSILGDRGIRLRQVAGDQLCAEISIADEEKMTISIDGDDYVLMAADEEQRCLIVEGISARYKIRAEDVVKLEPFVFTNYVGAKLTFRIDEQTELRIAIARVSNALEITRQLPFLFFLRSRLRNHCLEFCEQVLA